MKYSKISRSFLALLTIFVLITGFIPWRGFVPSAQAATLDPAQWTHMRSITIDNTGNASALTDYQVEVDTNDVFYDEDGLVGSWHMNEMSEPDANNLIDPSTWTVGSGSVTGFTRNGDDAENYRIDATTPFGGQDVVWEARPTAVSGADGGWNGSQFNVDSTKTYRFSVWVQRPVQGNGHFYLGTHGYGSTDGVLLRTTGANSTNPYFTVNSNWGEWGDNSSWYLAVGHVWPAGSGTGSRRADSGIYDTSGSLVYTSDLNDFVWRSETTTSNFRTYLYYSTDTSTRQRWVYPRVDVVDGNEPSIEELVNSAPTGVVNDLSGNNNNGTVFNGTALTTGKYSNALDFDGANDYVKITDNFVVNPTALTISSWIKKESGGSTSECALHKGSSTAIGTTDYWLGVDINDYLTATIGANQADIGWAAGQTTTLATYGTWYHLAATWDGSVVKVYINGTYNKQYNLSSYGNLTTPTRFGASSDGSSYQFKGTVDETKIYNRALSAAEVLAQYNASNVRLDYGDVRFTDSDGMTLLNYWMEKDGTFWAKVPSVPASSTKTIYMYYGNASAE